MSAIERQSEVVSERRMPFSVRPMEEGDVAQSAEIERDAFPTLFPPTSFRRELSREVASYLVAWRREEIKDTDAPDPYSEDGFNPRGGRPLVGRLIRNARSLLPGRSTTWEPGEQYLVGFLGTWHVLDEAHIVAIGVRTDFRSWGVGELLLIAAIEQAMQRNARLVTLEVRVSNYVAKNLYAKYGFKKHGVRKGYYADNREDALIMTTDPICDSPYPEEFRKLAQAHEARWGSAERRVV